MNRLSENGRGALALTLSSHVWFFTGVLQEIRARLRGKFGLNLRITDCADLTDWAASAASRNELQTIRSTTAPIASPAVRA